MAALALEEVAPLAVSDATLRTPGEVYAPEAKGEAKAEEELTQCVQTGVSSCRAGVPVAAALRSCRCVLAAGDRRGQARALTISFGGSFGACVVLVFVPEV